ncbi:MAG: PilZ domain-containing protein [Lentisphaerae bacterium]|nr:PilZ domain-containing protein [Lentisphaerota bacterium]
MDKQRHLERRETLAYWPAEDTVKGEHVGLVTNLTEEGIQIHSKHAFPKGQRLSIRIAVDATLIGTDHISVVVENVWCSASGVPGLNHAGFRIVDISDTARKGIRDLLWAFSYPIPPPVK